MRYQEFILDFEWEGGGAEVWHGCGADACFGTPPLGKVWEHTLLKNFEKFLEIDFEALWRYL